MNESKHTPGPWSHKVGGGDDYEEGSIEIYFDETGDGTPDAEVYVSDAPDDNSEANARLIAAAPELLATAQAFLSYGRKCPPGCPRGYDEAEKKLRAVIAKATGSAGTK